VCDSGARIRVDLDDQDTASMTNQPRRIFYGWRIVLAAFLNLFFAVGVIFYGFPVFYTAFVQSLGFTRAQVTQGFLLGFILVGLPFGLLAGVLIDRIGARAAILSGVGFVGVSLFLMGYITRLWHYEILCITEVLGYVLAGPIANQVLVARWFRKKRGRAMGYAYLGLGLGGVVAPLTVHYLLSAMGWRMAIQTLGLAILLILYPVGIWVTRSSPADVGLVPDGTAETPTEMEQDAASTKVRLVLGSANFWLILAGSFLVVGAIGAVIQHFILFLKDLGYSGSRASEFSTILLASSLAGRVAVGYMADRLTKKNIMAVFYVTIGAAVLLLGFSNCSIAIWMFAIVFGFSMGADYMLIPLVTAECFGTHALGKILGLIIMGYSLGQWGAPWLLGRIFDASHSYQLGWKIMGAAAIVGAAMVWRIKPSNPRS
jgi:MFS family permease